ncbi:MAG: outer membrane protein assembly factor BamD [Bacteroidota bacterium]
MKQLFGIILILVSLVSCGEYAKVLKNDSVSDKYELGKKFYEKGKEEEKRNKLNKAIKLLEQIQPTLRGKPQGESVAFMIADSYYVIGDDLLAGYQFERFIKSYPDSDKLELAAFKSANSYYRASPRFSLDQTDTYKAIAKLQQYIDVYPDGEYFAEANDKLKELEDKIEKKAYQVAKQIHHRELWEPAVHALDNFISDNPGSDYNEKAYFYKFESQYFYAMKSIRSVKEERIKEALEYYQDYTKRYPEGEFLEQTKMYSEELNNELDNLQ